MKLRGMVYDGSVAALPLAAAFALLAARALPIRFAYRPNELGIISVVSQMEYPKQQETFWLLFGVGAFALLFIAWARSLGRRSIPVNAVAGVELLGGCALLALLWLPGFAGVAACATAAAGAAWLALRAGAAASTPEAATPPPAPARRAPLAATLRAGLWGAALLVLALLLGPGLWVHLWNVAHAVPDAELAHDNFKFLAETGQHLAWANSLWNGGFQGRDFFCLYGPFFEMGLTGFWALAGRSVAATNSYLALTRVVGWLCLFGAAAVLVRRRPVILLLPFLVPYVKLRVGLALLAFCFFALWLKSGRRSECAASGVAAGVSLLYSQEYGVAFLVTAALGFALRRDGRAALIFAAGLLAVIAPTLGYHAAHGALGAMLHDIATYPRSMLAGYAGLPFPPLLSSLPLEVSQLGTRSSVALRLSYAVPAVCVAGLVLASGLWRLDWRRPLASLRELVQGLERDPERLACFLISLFGLISFRSALGRSDLPHLHAAMPGAVLVLCAGVDRSLDLWRVGPGRRPLAASRTALLAAFILLGAFVQSATPLANASKSLRLQTKLARFDHHPAGSQRVLRVVRWVQLNTAPGEPVLFLPNDAAYYYLSDRPNPIRFVLGHQIATDDHRRELLSDLRSRPPRYIVWDHDALVVDGIPHEQVFGDEIVRFFAESYEQEIRLGTIEILRRKGALRGRP
jgi:hypothetical protein